MNNIKRILDKQVRFIDFPIISSISDKIIGFWFSPIILYEVFGLGINYFYRVLGNNFSYSLGKISGKFDQFSSSFVFGFGDIKFESWFFSI